VGEVLLKKFVMRPDVADARPAAEFAAAEDCSVLAGTAVIPASRPANLSAELHERHVERRLHQAPFALKKNGARDAYVFRDAVAAVLDERLPVRHRAREVHGEVFVEGGHRPRELYPPFPSPAAAGEGGRRRGEGAANV